MSSVGLANQLLRLSQHQDKNSRLKGKNIVNEQEKYDLPKMYRQQINFGNDDVLSKKNNVRGYGQTTREAVNPDRTSYFRQNENINTIKGKKPKILDTDPTNPANGERTAANDVLNEFRWKYMSQKPVNQEGENAFVSPRPSSARKRQTEKTFDQTELERKEFSFTSNDFTEPERFVPRPKEKKSNKNVIQERGDAIPIDDVLKNYKSSRSYRDDLPKEIHSAPKIPKMSREDVEKEQARNEQLNARSRGFIVQQQQQIQKQQQQENIYQSIRQVNQQNPSKSNKSNSAGQVTPSNQGQTLPARDPNRTEKSTKIGISPTAAKLALEVNNRSSPPVNHKKKQTELQGNYILSEAEDKSFDVNEVLHGYKSKHVYKNNETPSTNSANPVALAKQRFEEKNTKQQSTDRERARLNKLRLYKQEDVMIPKSYDIKNSQYHDEILHTPGSDFMERHLTREEQIDSVMRSDVLHSRIPRKEVDEELIEPMEIEDVYDQSGQTNGQLGNESNSNDTDNEFKPQLHDEVDHEVNFSTTTSNNEIDTKETEVLRLANGYYHETPETLYLSRSLKFGNDHNYSDKTPEPLLGPRKEEKTEPTVYYRDREGRILINDPAPVQENSYKAVENVQKPESVIPNARPFSSQQPIKDIDDDFNLSRRSSSRSNPNVTFGKTAENEIVIDQFQFNSIYPNTNSYSKSELDPYIRATSPLNTQTTDMDRLDFTNTSTDLNHYSTNYEESSHDGARTPSEIHDGVDGGPTEDNDQYLAVLDKNREIKPRVESSGSYSSYSSIRSSIKSPYKKMKNGLPGYWNTGFMISSNERMDRSVEQSNDESTHTRNPPQLTDRRADALDSLTSLDRRLRSESGTNRMLFEDSMDWMIQDNAHAPKDERFYRESGQPTTGLPNLNERIQESGYKEGQDMRVTFYESLHKITALANQIVESVPKQHFPFKITPTSYQGDFEKKGPYKIDLYLNIDNLESYNHEVRFLVKNNLSAYIILNGDNREKLKHFCARNRASNEWVLSASRIMLMFSYLINTQVRPFIEHDSESKRRDLIDNALIKFVVVSETLVRFHVSFPGSNEAYNVGLILAFNVNEFPGVVEMGDNRKWPNTEAKKKVAKGGVHLTAHPGVVKNHAWAVSFLKTRKILLNVSDEYQTATNILLAFQVINKTALSNRECSGLLLPVHFIMILFWVHETYRDKLDWTYEKMSKRFLDVLITLKRCLERRLCPDFFFPKLNILDHLTEEQSFFLIQNVKDVLGNPSVYLHE